MIKLLPILILTMMVTGCVKNPQLKAVLEDFESTPRCNVDPVLTHPKDTKDTLTAKLLISNYKTACMSDWYYYFDKKLESYRKLL